MIFWKTISWSRTKINKLTEEDLSRLIIAWNLDPRNHATYTWEMIKEGAIENLKADGKKTDKLKNVQIIDAFYGPDDESEINTNNSDVIFFDYDGKFKKILW